MTRFSRGAKDEVPDKHSDNARERTKPKVEGRPLSPRAIERVHSEGKTYPLGKTAQTHEHQKNQMPEDRHHANYDNDVTSWANGRGSINGGLYPQFDHGKLDPASRPPKPATGLEATGQDMKASPFSAASHSRPSENDWIPNSKLNPRNK